MSTKTVMRIRALGLALAAFAAGCGGEQPGAGPEPVEKDAVKRRMNDPVYVQKLETAMEERRDIMRQYGEAMAKVKAAEEAGAGEEELAALKAAAQKFKDEGEANRQKAMKMVRERMNSDISQNLKQTKGN